MNINNIIDTATAVKSMPVESMTASAPGKVEAPEKVKAPEKIEDQEATANGEKNEDLSSQETKQLTSELNEIMDDLQTNLGFSIREGDAHQVIVEIKNQETNELIRQFPSEELLTLKEKMLELTGLIFDQSI
jgi:flagellar protein FlaG